jgi:two-component system NtrC family sensor kinase
MLPKTLKFKMGFYVAIALAATLLLFTTLVVLHQRNQFLQEAASRVSQLSEVIQRSTRFAMLQNQADSVHRIIRDVASQDGIDRVRIFSKEGRIIDSSYPPEIGMRVDQKAEGCILCHQSKKPLERIATSERSRIFTAADGRRLLGSMEVIRNEPSCYNAACHVHSKAQQVLGVLDIVYSLQDMDRTMRASAMTLAGISLGFVILAALSVSLLVHRFVYVPLRDLENASKRISSGNLDQSIPVRSDDEFGRLAGSFNSMTAALRNSHAELREWGRTLEQKVQERTRELRAAEAEAARGEKLASVGLLAAGVAHELNNPLTGILTFSSLIRKTMPEGSQDAQDMDLVIRETKRCAAIIRRLLDFAREKAPEKRFADLNMIVQDTVRILERPAHLSDIDISLDLDRSLPAIWVDEDLIKQVVMNILVNAEHAIEGGGTITIQTRRHPKPMSPEPGMDPVPVVELSIIDTGCGIPEKDLKRIFDPFFTTKEVGRGTGLGLSVSHGIVKAHGGTIRVESAVGKGSTFRIYLPLDNPGVHEAAGASYERQNSDR